MEKILVLGASRGLGFNVFKELTQQPFELFISSRNLQKLTSIASDYSLNENQYKSLDISKFEGQLALFEWIKEINPHRIVNLIGGGPFGEFEDKNWKDHAWAIEVNFLFVAKLLHFLFKENPTNLRQVVLTGSSVAENAPDPKAASYSASKHALKGLVFSLKHEKPDFDIRLFSPPYMDTEMLPVNAWPRQQSNIKVYDPKVISKDMVSWILSPANDKFHFTY